MIDNLYSALKRRRCGRAVTSESGSCRAADGGAPVALAASPLRSEAANATEEVLVLLVLIKVRFLSPPYSNCSRSTCLTHVGTEGSVVQVGPPPSVTSLRQRLGRSGRRKGEPMILRGYCIEEESDTPGISELLRENLLTTAAMVRLLADGWYEPIRANKLHASTLVQQILSTISQYGGVNASKLWSVLCANGPFSAVTPTQFASLLREL